MEKIVKKYRTTKYQQIKIQLVIELINRKISLIQGDLNILINLGMRGKTDLNVFCNEEAAKLLGEDSKDIFIKSQNIRNRLVKLEKLGLIIKEKESSKKTVRLPDGFLYETNNDLLLTYNFLYLHETTET